MAVQRGLLLIADIAGYTRFMEFHRTDLAHAQDVVARLLEAMIDATSALDLVEVEGDAAFMYRPLPGGTGPELVESALGQSVAMHGAFHALQQKIACLNNCPCQGCAQVGNLKVKFVAHLGDVAPQRVKRLTRLAGSGTPGPSRTPVAAEAPAPPAPAGPERAAPEPAIPGRTRGGPAGRGGHPAGGRRRGGGRPAPPGRGAEGARWPSLAKAQRRD